MKKIKDNIEVVFLDNESSDVELLYSVIVGQYNGKWVLCRHKDRTTYEVPGGHIEEGESADEAAKRELYEETGAKEYTIEKVCIYGVRRDTGINYGALYFAEIESLGELPQMEIEEINLFDSLPENLTYPSIQPQLFHYVQGWMQKKSMVAKHKAVIFDLDGTLFDHFGAADKALDDIYASNELYWSKPLDVFKSLNRTLHEKYFVLYKEGQISWEQQRLLRMKALHSHYKEDISEEEAREHFGRYLEAYEKNWRLFEGAKEVLSYLKGKGCKIGMITNGEHSQQMAKVEAGNIADFFDSIIISSDAGIAKPDVSIFEFALNELGVKSSEAVFIGDSITSDIQGANNSGIESIYIIRDHNKDSAIDFKPDYIIEELIEIMGIVK